MAGNKWSLYLADSNNTKPYNIIHTETPSLELGPLSRFAQNLPNFWFSFCFRFAKESVAKTRQI